MIKFINHNQFDPFYATTLSSSFDVFSNEPVSLAPMERKTVGTGLFLDKDQHEALAFIEETEGTANLEVQIRPRSGLAAKKGITLANGVGIVDLDFLDPNEIKVLLVNLGNLHVSLPAGERIAQIAICVVMRAPGIEIKQTTRTGGFGSTGTKA